MARKLQQTQTKPLQKPAELEAHQTLSWIQESLANPIEWVSKALKVTRFSKGEAEILAALPRAIAERKPIVVASGHAQGKDFICSTIPLWFLCNYYPSKSILTAPTDRQVKEIMWGEIQQRWNDAPVKLPGRIITCKVDVEPNHFVLGFTTKETGNMTGKFQGFHSQHICVIVSEAQAVADNIFEQMEGVLTSSVALQVLIGNPLRSSGKFARMIKDTTNNIVIHLSALDSPNYRHRREVIPGMASYEWVEEKRKAWGEQHPLWFSRVLGELPPGGIDSVFSLELIDQGRTQTVRSTIIKRTVSCDPAGMGDDECVVNGMDTGVEVKKDIMPQSKAGEVCSHVLQVVKEIGANHVTVERDGLGGPIADFVEGLASSGVTVDGVSMAGKSSDPQYANFRAEVYFFARGQLEKGLVSIPKDDVFLEEELAETKYFFNLKGKIQIESKEDIKERLGRSPNRADAWVLNVWGQAQAERIYKNDSWDQDHSPESSGVSTSIQSAMGA